MNKTNLILILITVIALSACAPEIVSGTYTGTFSTFQDTTYGSVVIKPNGDEVTVQVSSNVFPTVTIDHVSLIVFNNGYYQLQNIGYPGAYVEGSVFTNTKLLEMSYIDTAQNFQYQFYGYK